MKWDWLWDLAPYLPPALVGSFIGLRYTTNQTPKQRVLSFVAGACLAVFVAPALAEHFALGPRVTMAVGLLTAIVGMDIIGGLLAVGTQFKADPTGTVRGWVDTWLGRNK
jgi:hypothetical protein